MAGGSGQDHDLGQPSKEQIGFSQQPAVEELYRF
jgi:hypothetical protein